MDVLMIVAIGGFAVLSGAVGARIAAGKARMPCDTEAITV
jgi:hypothetical protein